MTSTLDKMWAIVRRDLLTAIRHRSGFALTLLSVLMELAAFFFLSRAIGGSFRPAGMDYFPFVLVGTGIYTFFVMSAQAFLSTIQEAQQTGTMEVLMTTSTQPAELVILSSISAFTGTLVSLSVYLLAGVAVFRAAIHPDVLSCLLVIVFSMMIAMALGIAVAALQITLQKGSAVLWLLSSGLWFLSGAMFPSASLPPALQRLSQLLPITYAIEGMRMALLQHKSALAMAPTLIALGAFGSTLLVLALSIFLLSLQHSRKNGTLSFY
jgi:ABC-2 type transport system permease protein